MPHLSSRGMSVSGTWQLEQRRHLEWGTTWFGLSGEEEIVCHPLFWHTPRVGEWDFYREGPLRSAQIISARCSESNCQLGSGGWPTAPIAVSNSDNNREAAPGAHKFGVTATELTMRTSAPSITATKDTDDLKPNHVSSICTRSPSLQIDNQATDQDRTNLVLVRPHSG